jgi:hypothetical protein
MPILIGKVTRAKSFIPAEKERDHQGQGLDWKGDKDKKGPPPVEEPGEIIEEETWGRHGWDRSEQLRRNLQKIGRVNGIICYGWLKYYVTIDDLQLVDETGLEPVDELATSVPVDEPATSASISSSVRLQAGPGFAKLQRIQQRM